MYGDIIQKEKYPDILCSKKPYKIFITCTYQGASKHYATKRKDSIRCVSIFRFRPKLAGYKNVNEDSYGPNS